jgi:hypothetical protein
MQSMHDFIAGLDSRFPLRVRVAEAGTRVALSARATKITTIKTT